MTLVVTMMNGDVNSERVFSFRDHASLWFSLGVGLLVMQVGAYLVPAASVQSAFFSILVGSIFGAGLLGLVAQLGSNHGLPSSGLIQQTFGSRFSKIPVMLNIIQLLGWTAFELVIIRDVISDMSFHATELKLSWVPLLVTICFGGLLFVLASSHMIRLVRKFVSSIGMPLVVLSLIWLTTQFVMRLHEMPGGFLVFWNQVGSKSGVVSTISSIDLVMAMPVSWLPLVADYARYDSGNSKIQSALKGTWFGYAVANIWCYALGVLVVSTSAPGVDLVTTLMLAQFGLVALGLIMIDEVDNAYGDVHSGAVSLNYLFSKYDIKFWGKWMAIGATVAAMFLPMHSFEAFLLVLSSVFVSLFGVVIAWLSWGGKATTASVHWPLIAIWLIGVAISYGTRTFFPEFGQTIVSLIAVVSLTACYRFLRVTMTPAATPVTKRIFDSSSKSPCLK